MKVYIKTKKGNVIARLPESIELTFTQKFTNPFEKATEQSAIIGYMAEKKNSSLVFANADHFVWVGGEPIILNIPLVFIAENSLDDIREPINILNGASLPSEGGVGGTLIPPEKGVYIKIGKFLSLKDVIIVSVSNNLGKPWVVGGFPGKAEVSLSVQVPKIATTELLKEIFGGESE